MKIKFWVAIGQETQLDFDGRSHTKEVPVGQQHIVFNEVLMCGQSRLALKGANKKQSLRMTRFVNVVLCPDCERLFKAHTDSPWKKWERQVLYETR